MRTFLSLTFVSVITTLCSITQVVAESGNELILASEVKWVQLNPARGDKSPMAGTLWGDLKASVPTGFLVKFVDGFSSPPHIHNITYRGVVISGLIHNDDPDAADMWMPTGSFWTQPKGENHITAAKGETSVAFIEIDHGPYLVLPTDKMFDSVERPINVDVSNIVWLDALNTAWIDQPETSIDTNGVKLAFLWGKPEDDQFNGTLVKLPVGFTVKLNSNGTIFRAVVIQGQPQYQFLNETDIKNLMPGSYFSSKGKSMHQVSCKADEECIIYVRTKGKFSVIPN